MTMNGPPDFGPPTRDTEEEEQSSTVSPDNSPPAQDGSEVETVDNGKEPEHKGKSTNRRYVEDARPEQIQVMRVVNRRSKRPQFGKR